MAALQTGPAELRQAIEKELHVLRDHPIHRQHAYIVLDRDNEDFPPYIDPLVHTELRAAREIRRIVLERELNNRFPDAPAATLPTLRTRLMYKALPLSIKEMDEDAATRRMLDMGIETYAFRPAPEVKERQKQHHNYHQSPGGFWVQERPALLSTPTLPVFPLVASHEQQTRSDVLDRRDRDWDRGFIHDIGEALLILTGERHENLRRSLHETLPSIGARLENDMLVPALDEDMSAPLAPTLGAHQ